MLYEFHITLKNVDKTNFTNFCKINNIKPIVLDIQKKDGLKMYEEVMTSSTKRLKNDHEAIKYIKELSNKLKHQGFSIIREKIEAESTHNDVDKLISGKYLESHLNVLVRTSTDLQHLSNVCIKHDCHLSKNINKVTKNGSIIMVTYRDSVKLAIFKNKLNAIINDIKSIPSNSINIEKEVIEYAIYDSNLDYDKLWLQ
jgi:hypothetical protein